MHALGRWVLDAFPPFITMVLAVAAASLLLTGWRARRSGWRTAIGSTTADAALLISLGVIALLTLGQPIGPQPDRINLLPFRDQIWAFEGQVDPVIAAATLLGNVALFVPFGVALAYKDERRSAWLLIGVALLVSVAVEAAQAALDIGRLADVTDVLANTVGAALGIGLWRAFTSGSRDRRRA